MGIETTGSPGGVSRNRHEFWYIEVRVQHQQTRGRGGRAEPDKAASQGNNAGVAVKTRMGYRLHRAPASGRSPLQRSQGSRRKGSLKGQTAWREK